VLTSKGAMQVTLEKHLLRGGNIPKNVEELIDVIQQNIPQEIFDPNGNTITSSVSKTDSYVQYLKINCLIVISVHYL